jgi:hypothetical protein
MVENDPPDGGEGRLLSVAEGKRGRFGLMPRRLAAIEITDSVRRNLRQALSDFQQYPDPVISSVSKGGAPRYGVSIPPTAHPYAELLRVVLEAGLEFPNLGRFEKTAWEIPFLFRHARCSLALQKFGVRMFIDIRDSTSDDAQTLAKEAVRQLVRGLRTIERDVLESFAREQVARGNVTVANQSAALRSSYEYFRERAQGQPSPVTEFEDDPSQGLADAFEAIFRGHDEVLNNSVAAISAYFSLLEHVLVLLLPFSGFDAETESLTSFIGHRWRDKFKRVFDISTDKIAKGFHDELHQLAEEHRNPYAHGGFDKEGGSLYFHVQGFSALPARLSDASTVPYFHFVDSDEGLASAWDLFDRVDSWLRSGETRYGMRYVESGLDIRFDTETIAEVRVATVSDEAFEEYLERLTYDSDRATNMDW